MYMFNTFNNISSSIDSLEGEYQKIIFDLEKNNRESEKSIKTLNDSVSTNIQKIQEYKIRLTTLRELRQRTIQSISGPFNSALPPLDLSVCNLQKALSALNLKPLQTSSDHLWPQDIGDPSFSIL